MLGVFRFRKASKQGGDDKKKKKKNTLPCCTRRKMRSWWTNGGLGVLRSRRCRAGRTWQAYSRRAPKTESLRHAPPPAAGLKLPLASDDQTPMLLPRSEALAIMDDAVFISVSEMFRLLEDSWLMNRKLGGPRLASGLYLPNQQGDLYSFAFSFQEKGRYRDFNMRA